MTINPVSKDVQYDPNIYDDSIDTTGKNLPFYLNV